MNSIFVLSCNYCLTIGHDFFNVNQFKFYTVCRLPIRDCHTCEDCLNIKKRFREFNCLNKDCTWKNGYCNLKRIVDKR